MAKKTKELDIYKLVQTITDSVLGLLFLIGLVPFAYYFMGWGAVVLAIVSLVMACLAKNRTKPYTIANLIFAVLAFIPVVGSVFKILGIIFVALNITKLWKKN